MVRTLPGCPDSDPSCQLASADVSLRQEPDEDEDEGDGNDDDNDEDGDDTDDNGYSE